ncbi:MAG: AAA family ATPase [Gallionella sp.]|nr:AAA family ATPase [Gallionella sp.]
MYLEHFGLNEPPFRITPVTMFFFSGAHRGQILDALIYSLSEAEGIIKVSGEVGSGKTMLCRMLLERLPKHFETIYLANPSLSREEMLYAIADALGLDINGERVGVIMQKIQKKLEDKAREGKRVVVLVDEAHAMPLDTLEELRLLYNLQAGNTRLLQIILFGQPELNAKLEQPNMRQLKDRIVHHFNMQPLSRNILENYLMFRMRAAGYHGPNIFSPNALKLIADASHGLMRRANILADKSLLAAFVEDTHNIEARHVQAAMRDCEIRPPHPLSGKGLWIGGATAALLLSSLAAWWMSDRPQPEDQSMKAETGYSADMHSDKTVTGAPGVNLAAGDTPQVALSSPVSEPATPVIAAPVNDKLSLLEQRLAAGKELLEQAASTGSGQGKAVASIQLFYNDEILKGRIENFLKRAKGLGKLSEIYLIPAKFGSKNGLRVLYGAYPSVEAARNAVKDLPKRYQDAFTVSIYTL